MTTEQKIQEFWEWFEANEADLIVAIDSETVTDYYVNSLDNFILDLGKFSWEIGPLPASKWRLTISPNSEKELLKISRKIIAMAPSFSNWEFLHSKPAKEWDQQFHVYDDFMYEKEVDARNWHYVTLNDANQFELILEADNIDHLDAETALTAAHSFVEGELGEEMKINKIASIAIVPKLKPEHESGKRHISSLKDHILKF